MEWVIVCSPWHSMVLIEALDLPLLADIPEVVAVSRSPSWVGLTEFKVDRFDGLLDGLSLSCTDINAK